MTRRVLLMRPNCTQDMRDHYVTFPLGLGYVAAVLKQAGQAVSIIDLTLEDVDYEDLAGRIRRIDPQVIGLTGLSYEYLQIKRLADYLKTVTACPIVLGGHAAFQNYDLVLERTAVDICVIGEGELTITDLLEHMDDLATVKGIAYRAEGRLHVNEPRELIGDLDRLPLPAYELFDVDKYAALLMDDIYLSKRYLPKRSRYRKMSMEAGRGCPFACDFCSKMFRKIRKRSVENICTEMRFLRDTHGINVFGFQDELLFSNKAYILEFCRAVKPLGVSWFGNARINTIDREILEAAIASGCLIVSYGVESGSAKILERMNKKTRPAQIEEVLRLTLDVGMPIDMGLILGYPGEDRRTVQETVDLLRQVGYPGLKFRYITPYPGSALYKRSLADGTIPDEEAYLESLGDGSGPYRFRINFTKFSDEELRNLVPETTRRVLHNYLIYLLKHPRFLWRYLRQKDVMNPIYYYYHRTFHATNYDKAARKR